MVSLDFLAALSPFAPAKKRFTFQIVIHTESVIVGIWNDPAVVQRVCIVGKISRNWLEQYCDWFLRIATKGYLAQKLSDQEPWRYLNDVFIITDGRSEFLATEESHGISKLPFPEKHTRVKLGWKFDPYDSYLISRGFVPQCMEDKWFIYLEGDQLFFRRSWSGICAFKVMMRIAEDGMEATECLINQDSQEYSFTNTDHEVRMVRWLIDFMLLKNDVDMPCIHSS